MASRDRRYLTTSGLAWRNLPLLHLSLSGISCNSTSITRSSRDPSYYCKPLTPPRYRAMKAPLHYFAISNDPLSTRLPAMRAALASGEDPNKIAGSKNPGLGRPLHYAIDDSAGHDYAQLKQNLPVIELLLKEGADPRLPNQMGKSPIEELEAWFREYDKGHETWAEEDLGLYDFNKAALETMKVVAAKLDGVEKTPMWKEVVGWVRGAKSFWGS